MRYSWPIWAWVEPTLVTVQLAPIGAASLAFETLTQTIGFISAPHPDQEDTRSESAHSYPESKANQPACRFRCSVDKACVPIGSEHLRCFEAHC